MQSICKRGSHVHYTTDTRSCSRQVLMWHMSFHQTKYGATEHLRPKLCVQNQNSADNCQKHTFAPMAPPAKQCLPRASAAVRAAPPPHFITPTLPDMSQTARDSNQRRDTSRAARPKPQSHATRLRRPFAYCTMSGTKHMPVKIKSFEMLVV